MTLPTYLATHLRHCIAARVAHGTVLRQMQSLTIAWGHETGALYWTLRISAQALEIRAIRAELQGDQQRSDTLRAQHGALLATCARLGAE